MKADLHTHTTFSDGTKTNIELLTMAKENGLDIISITDHDTCSNVEENMNVAKDLGITYIPGIELSTLERNKSVHVLGYFTDKSYENKEMKDYYVFIKKSREDRTKKFIVNLKQHFNIIITYEDVLSFSEGIIARPHIAKAINLNYPEYSFNYIFREFIGDYSKAYVPSSKLKVEEGIELLRRNNCVVVLAHPILLKQHIREQVLSYNYDGIEARYYRNNEQDEDLFKALASKRGMFITGGSDYHGIENDEKHGTVGDYYIGDDIKDFLTFYKDKVQL